jgi:hypothetical protein
MRPIDNLLPQKSMKWAVTLGFIFMLISCGSDQSEEKKRNLVSKEHAALIGTWQEEDSLKTTVWIFDQHEVKWKGFTHTYRVSGDSLIISGLVYPILEQSDKKIKLMNLEGKPVVLNRKDQ